MFSVNQYRQYSFEKKNSKMVTKFVPNLRQIWQPTKRRFYISQFTSVVYVFQKVFNANFVYFWLFRPNFVQMKVTQNALKMEEIEISFSGLLKNPQILSTKLQNKKKLFFQFFNIFSKQYLPCPPPRKKFLTSSLIFSLTLYLKKNLTK